MAHLSASALCILCIFRETTLCVQAICYVTLMLELHSSQKQCQLNFFLNILILNLLGIFPNFTSVQLNNSAACHYNYNATTHACLMRVFRESRVLWAGRFVCDICANYGGHLTTVHMLFMLSALLYIFHLLLFCISANLTSPQGGAYLNASLLQQLIEKRKTQQKEQHNGMTNANSE